MKQYRVHKITKMDSDEVSKDLVWSGTDTDDLSRRFPPSKIWGADPLGYSQIEGGMIEISYLYECSEDEGQTWQTCEDPRRRITPVTELEMEIDAENRRRFPGDFIEDEYDEDDDGGWDDQWGDQPSYDESSYDSWDDEDYEDNEIPA